MRTRYIASALVVCIALGGWYAIYQKNTPSKASIQTPKQTVMVNIPKKQIKQHQISPKDNQLVMLDDDQTQNQPSSTAKELTVEPIDTTEAKEYIEPRKFVKPIAALHIDMQELTTLEPDDTINIPSIEDNDYQIKVENVEENKNLKSIFGSFDDEGVHYSTVITVDKDGGYMTLNTPKGIYEVEIDQGYGYIYHSSDIRRALSDESKTDNQIIEVPSETIETI